VELQRIAGRLEAAGVALFAISYDSVETLAAFGEKHGITYPLLSDEGSQTIQRLGMLDEDLDRHHAEFGRAVRDDQRGVAYPATFLLDRDGVVLRKRIHPNYRIRDTGTGLLEAILDIPSPAPRSTDAVDGETVQIRGALDSPTYRPFQQLQLTVELSIRDGWHVYTTPIPAGYIPLSIEVAPFDGLAVGQISIPAGRKFTIAGIDEEFSVLKDTVRVRIPLTLSVAPGRGDLNINATIRYQACSDTACLPPASAHMDLQISQAPFAE